MQGQQPSSQGLGAGTTSVWGGCAGVCRRSLNLTASSQVRLFPPARQCSSVPSTTGAPRAGTPSGCHCTVGDDAQAGCWAGGATGNVGPQSSPPRVFLCPGTSLTLQTGEGQMVGPAKARSPPLGPSGPACTMEMSYRIHSDPQGNLLPIPGVPCLIPDPRAPHTHLPLLPLPALLCPITSSWSRDVCPRPCPCTL